MSLHFVESGNSGGEPIVFLHGAGLASWSWHDVINRLSGYHCIAVDLPGHGDSNHIPAESLGEMAARVADFITDTVPGGKAHVVGLSLGGITTIEMMRYRPDVIKSAVVSGVNAIPLPFMTRLMVRLTQPLLKSDFFIKQNARLLQMDEHSTQLYFNSMKQLDVKTLGNVMPEILNYAPAENLHGIDVPVLFVAGSSEDRINVESVSILGNAMDFAAGVLAPELHHGWSGENPELFADYG